MRLPTRSHRLRDVLGVVLLSTALSSSAAAQQAAPPGEVAAAVQKLRSGEEGQIRAALDELRIAGASAAGAAPAVADVLSRGLSEPLTLQAIETLADLESSAGSGVLAEYASHRKVALRRAAIHALTRTRGPAATPALRRALSDADAQVRGTAASGLGTMKAKDATADLFVALDHKVHEAAASIGQLCAPDQCVDLASRIGKLPFEVVTSGLEPVLFRPAAEISDDVKMKVLGRLRELGTGDAHRFLSEVQQRMGKEGSPRVRQALDQAVKATSGGVR